MRELGPALAQGGGVRRHNLTDVPVTWYTFQLLDTNSSELELSPMTITKTPDAVAVVEPILEHLQQAWNAGDGMGFAGPFAEDADFVEIRGGHHHGAVAVGRGHEAIFSTIYAGSTSTSSSRWRAASGPASSSRSCTRP